MPSLGCPVGQGKGVSGQQSGAARSGRLLALLSSGSAGSGKKSDRYQNTPRLGLVMSGCHAVLQFVGCAENVSGSLLDTGWCVNNLYYTVRIYRIRKLHVCSRNRPSTQENLVCLRYNIMR